MKCECSPPKPRYDGEETEVPSEVMTWTDNGDPGTDYCVACVRARPGLRTDAHVLMRVYDRCARANAARLAQ